MIELDEVRLYSAITDLNNTQFPEATVVDFCHKAMEELEEVIDAPKSKRLGEFADSLICIFAGAAKDGWAYEELMMAVAAKTSVNRVRKFKRLPDGTYKHIEGE